jgi:hypothetical protein
VERGRLAHRGHLQADAAGLVGVYLRGSAALGGFTSASDLDVLVIADGPIPIAAVGQRLLGAVTEFPLELSIVTGAATAVPAPPFPFVVHVASPDRVVADDGGGDADLIAHFAVCRVSGVALSGPVEVIGPIDRHRLLAYLAHELHSAISGPRDTCAHRWYCSEARSLVVMLAS